MTTPQPRAPWFRGILNRIDDPTTEVIDDAPVIGLGGRPPNDDLPYAQPTPQRALSLNELKKAIEGELSQIAALDSQAARISAERAERTTRLTELRGALAAIVEPLMK